MTAAPALDLKSIGKDVLVAACVFGAASVFGFVVLVALFKSGLLARSIDILFYRGVVLSLIAALVTIVAVGYAGRRFGFASARDALAAGALVLGFNLSFVVIAPVTVDRSISVFILGTMAASPGQAMSVEDLRDVFTGRYLGDWRQIERRMDEQTVSGNVKPVAGGFVLTPQGAGFIRTAKTIAWMFDTDPRFVVQTPYAPRQAAK